MLRCSPIRGSTAAARRPFALRAAVARPAPVQKQRGLFVSSHQGKSCCSAAAPVVAVDEDDGLGSFKSGFQRFKHEVLAANPARFKDLALVQSPKTMVIGCCDSRVDPAMLFHAEPGDLFIVRNVANLVPPFVRGGSYHGTSAALEFAVTGLKVEHIIVLGHQRCGGIAALMRRASAPATDQKTSPAVTDFIDRWMEIGQAASQHTLLTHGSEPFEAQCACCERESINVSLANLLTFPWIKSAVSAGKLRLHGWYYNLDDAKLETWNVRYAMSPVKTVV